MRNILNFNVNWAFTKDAQALPLFCIGMFQNGESWG